MRSGTVAILMGPAIVTYVLTLWLGRYRRMSRDYEYLPESQRANVHICMIRLMLQRLTA